MKKVKPVQWLQAVRNHRGVYRFGGPWAQAVMYAVPWINAIILFFLFYLYHESITITPGIIFDLPPAPLREGSHTGLTALMFSVNQETMSREEAMVFFDDSRFMVEDNEQMSVLAEQIRVRLQNSSNKDFLLLADKRVKHGDILRFVNILRNAGVSKVNVAEKPE